MVLRKSGRTIAKLRLTLPPGNQRVTVAM